MPYYLLHYSTAANIFCATRFPSTPIAYNFKIHPYLKCPRVITHHLHSLNITTTCGRCLTFPSIMQHTKNSVLDFHLFNVLKPIKFTSIPQGLQANKPYASLPTRSLVLQHPVLCNHRKLVDMCHHSA